MLYRLAGNTGEKLSILGFGCMRFPTLDNKPHVIDEEKAQAMLDYAIGHGVNYFDTAWMYHAEIPFQAGTSELFVGKALKRDRQKVRLATKLPIWLVNSRADMDRFLDRQLERLQTDHIDFYLLHGLDAVTWHKLHGLGVVEFLETALADGKIKHAGFSSHDESGPFKKLVDAYDWSFCQIQYNYMDENFQAGREGLEHAAAKGLAVVIMEPLRGGALANKVPALVQSLMDQAKTRRSPAEWALRFVWDRPEVTVVLSGMSEMAQVVENIRLADGGQPRSLTRDELHIIENIKAIYQARTKVNCTGCRYCMPCPNGVNIPINFLQLNDISIYDDRGRAEFMYQHILKEQERAANCGECGQCEDACPQHIPIRHMLKEVVRELGPRA